MNLTLIILPIMLIVYGAIIYLFVLLVKALRKYIKSKDVREEKKAVCRSLGEALKAHRTEKQMTQEFVAETLGISRQAVSKWENGTSDPSTSNLCALAKLYGIPVEDSVGSILPYQNSSRILISHPPRRSFLGG